MNSYDAIINAIKLGELDDDEKNAETIDALKNALRSLHAENRFKAVKVLEALALAAMERDFNAAFDVLFSPPSPLRLVPPGDEKYIESGFLWKQLGQCHSGKLINTLYRQPQWFQRWIDQQEIFSTSNEARDWLFSLPSWTAQPGEKRGSFAAPFRVLLDKGWKPDPDPTQHDWPLLKSCEYLDPGSLALLLKAGANPNRVNSSGNFGLYDIGVNIAGRNPVSEQDAIERGRLCIKLLLESGAELKPKAPFPLESKECQDPFTIELHQAYQEEKAMKALASSIRGQASPSPPQKKLGRP